MDKDLIRLKRIQSVIERKTKAWERVMKNHPEGIMKDNIQQLKDEIKKEEIKIKKRKTK